MKRLLLIISTLLCLTAVPVATASADFNVLSDACKTTSSAKDSKVSDATACSATTADPITGPNGIIKKVSLLLAILAGIAAVIIIIFSGFRYVTSAGDAKKAADALSGIVGAAVGLVIIASAETIVVFVVSKI